MGLLEAMATSALVIFLTGAIVGGIVFLLMWAIERNRGIEMFIAIVIAMTWTASTLVLYMTG